MSERKSIDKTIRAYVEGIEAELTRLRAENERLRAALEIISMRPTTDCDENFWVARRALEGKSFD